MSLPLHAAAPRWAARATIAAASIVALLACLAGAATATGVGAHDRLFTFADGPWAQTLTPARDVAPSAWSPSSWAAQGAMLVAKGRRSAPRDAAAVVVAATGAVFALALVDAGVPAFAALVAMLGLVFSEPFWWRGSYWTPDAVAPLAAVAAVWLCWRWQRDGRARQAVWASLLAALAILDDPAWSVIVPAAAVACWPRARAGTRPFVVAVAMLLAALAIVPVADEAALARGLSWAEVAGVAAPDGWALLTSPVATIATGSSIRAFAGGLSSIALILSLVGFGVAWAATAHRAALATLAATAALWLMVVPADRLAPGPMPLLVACWLLVAVALAWARRTLPEKAAVTLVGVAGMLLVAGPGFTGLRMSALGADAGSEQLARQAYDFRLGDLGANVAMVSVSRRADATIRLSSQQAGLPATFIPQDIAALQAAMDHAVAIAALSPAREHAERQGFLFERKFAGVTPVGLLAGRAACVELRAGEWIDVSLLAADGTMSLQGPLPFTAPGGAVIHVSSPASIGLAAIDPRFATHTVTPRADRAQAGIDALARAADGVADAADWPVTTLTLAHGDRPSAISLTLDSPPAFAVATADGSGPVWLCPGPLASDLMLGAAPEARTVVSLAARRPFGPGWHDTEVALDPFRWTSAARSAVTVSVAPSGRIRITVTATPAARAAQHPTIALAVNTCRLESKPMAADQADYEWDTEASCWQAGRNRLWLETGPLVSAASLGTGADTRPLGARIGAIRLGRLP